MAEDYVRPPLLADEPRSPRATTWRFRLVFALLLAAMVAGVVLLIRDLTTSSGEGSPGVNHQGAGAPVSVSAAV